jgi:magnesium transporter
MARFYKKRVENQGLPPGSLVFIGQKKVEHPSIELITYNLEKLSEPRSVGLDEIHVEEGRITWYNIVGLDDAEFMKGIREKFDVHPLFMEDIMNTGQRAKFEELDDMVFISMKMLRYNKEEHRVSAEQISFILKENLLICFQEEPGDTFNAVRNRLKNPDSNLRRLGSGYLAYALIDSIIDNYIYLIEALGEQIDNLELEVIDDPNEATLQKINNFKRELHYIMKVIKPVRDLMIYLLRSKQQTIFDKNVTPFYKDLSDMITHAVESVETYRVILTDYIQLYHSSMSTRMNDIMKILTIFSAIFIPLSFFAGVYGTNFENFPELQYEYAYFIWWGVVVMIALGMLWFFNRKGWL